MPQLAILLVVFVTSAFGQNCVKYGATATLRGTLLMRDEAGYNQYVAIRLARAICTVVDPKDADQVADPRYGTQSGVREIQVGVYGSDSASDALRDRLNRLIGHDVVIKGDLFPRTTGYERTNPALRVEAIDPADLSGRRALLAPKVEVQFKDIEVYDVTINAGKRLVIDVRESGSTTPLVPPDQYVTHWMTGLEVVYVDCRDGYERHLIGSTEKDGGTCFDRDLCGLNAFPKMPVILELRCTKKH